MSADGWMKVAYWLIAVTATLWIFWGFYIDWRDDRDDRKGK